MLRVLLTIVLPLVLPTALYLAWIRTMQGVEGGPPRWRALPWVWLVGAGTPLRSVGLVGVDGRFCQSGSCRYVPPRWGDWRRGPAHVRPGRCAGRGGGRGR